MRNAIVTGGCRGIGRYIVKELLSENYSVVCLCRHATHDEELEIHDHLKYFQFDVSSLEEIKEMIQNVKDHFNGNIDVLINNAGINPPPSGIGSISIEDSLSVVNTNMLGAYWLSEEFIKHASNNASIIFISSIFGALKSSPGAAVYSASKAALANITQSMARAFGPKIRVNAVAPGLVETDLLWKDKDFLADRISFTPLGRIGLPKDVADCVSFLISDRASFITGAVIPVDGGLSLR